MKTIVGIARSCRQQKRGQVILSTYKGKGDNIIFESNIAAHKSFRSQPDQNHADGNYGDDNEDGDDEIWFVLGRELTESRLEFREGLNF